MGEKAELGHIIYSVFETQWLTQIGTGLDARVPQHRFFLVRLSAANSSNNDLLVPAITVEDDSGNTYSELPDARGVADWIGVLRSVKPAEAAQGFVVFDCPPKHYKMRITDEAEQRVGLVDLPLSFLSEAPDIVLPEAGKK